MEKSIARLDAALRPVATSSTDPLDPDWEAKMRAFDPIREAGLTKSDTESVLRDVLARYADGDDATRSAIRGMFDRYTSFGWAVHPPRQPTPESYRLRLLYFSATDQGRDARDELLGLNDLVTGAKADGVDITEMLVEIAAMSSDVDKYGMGSTRAFLLGCAGRKPGRRASSP